MPRSFWLLLKRIHRRAARRRRTRAAVQATSCVAMLMANMAITMLMAGGFMAGGGGTSCVHAGVLYMTTFVMVALSVALDLKARKQRRRLYRLMLCLDAEHGA